MYIVAVPTRRRPEGGQEIQYERESKTCSASDCRGHRTDVLGRHRREYPGFNRRHVERGHRAATCGPSFVICRGIYLYVADLRDDPISLTELRRDVIRRRKRGNVPLPRAHPAWACHSDGRRRQ